MIPVHSKIHPFELNDKLVEFQIPTLEGQVAGIGHFSAERNGNGFDYIDLVHDVVCGENIRRMTYPLPQEMVDLIKLAPLGAGFTLEARGL